MFGVGVGLPFGRINAGQLKRLCQAAGQANAGAVFTSPQRILVFSIADRVCAERLLQAADELHLISSADDVRLGMHVCTGSPGCRNATTDTRRDAQRLAETLNGALLGHSVHISGCAKGCACRSAADVTLVAHTGRYDLIRNGCPGDAVAIAGVEPDDISNAVSRFILEAAS